MRAHIFSIFLSHSSLLAVSVVATYAAVHNPALSGGTLLLLKDPANTSPPVTLDIQWPYGPPPTSGSLTVTVDSSSTTKVDLVGGASTSTITWNSPPYPASIQVKAKAVSAALNDITINIQHDSSPVSSIQLTAMKVEATLKRIVVPSATTPVRYYPGNTPITDARIGLDNTANFEVGLRVTPSQAVNSVQPALIQFGGGHEARYYRNPPPNVTKSASNASGSFFDGELNEQNSGWSKNSSLGVWITTSSAADVVELVGSCQMWNRLTRGNQFTVDVQYSIDAGISWHGILQGRWSFSGDGSAGAFSNGQYPYSGPGATITIDAQFTNSGNVASTVRNPTLNALLNQYINQ